MSTEFSTIAQVALNDPKLAVVSRVRTALEKPQMGTLPASCTTIKAKFGTQWDIVDLIHFVSKALRTGAGVNVHLDNFKETKLSYNSNRKHRVTFESNFTNNQVRSYIVSDSMEETSHYWDAYLGQALVNEEVYYPSIEDACFFAYKAGQDGADVNFDLSKLRPVGARNPQGMVSSGPDSFAFLIEQSFNFGKKPNLGNLLSFLSAFNQELRRGGAYKNGALTTSMPCWNDYALAYINQPKENHPWLKKGLVVTQDWLTVFDHLIEPALAKINDGSLWLEKATMQTYEGDLVTLYSDSHLDNRLLSNVCREVLLESQQTCDLTHVNAGQCLSPKNLADAFKLGIEFLCQLKAQEFTKSAGIYKPVSEDRQVGLGVLGLANQLAILGITYADFNAALSNMLRLVADNQIQYVDMDSYGPIGDANQLAWAYFWAYQLAGEIAGKHNMRRAFVIAPTANSSFRHIDANGFTTAPEISAPISLESERVSETTEDPEIFTYHPESETAAEVGWVEQKRFINNWQALMETTNRAHSISFNIWEDLNEQDLEWFMNSRVHTTYYRLDTQISYFDKANPFDGIQCACVG